ncbi:MAG TPA: malate dehydrogenase (quinone) [Pontiella sp.]
MGSTSLSSNVIDSPDIALIGGGVMSATLGMLLKLLNPNLTIQIIEALPSIALESSAGANNAGTGHAALCELNYTPNDADGNVDISKAIRINEQFEVSKYFWAHLVELGVIQDPGSFIQRVAHMSFVRGQDNQDFLRRRHVAMQAHPFFQQMELSSDRDEIAEWAPLLIKGRDPDEALAATRVGRGTDVNFGSLSRQMLEYLAGQRDVGLLVDTSVTHLSRTSNGRWRLQLKRRSGEVNSIDAGFAFIGAGGGALPLLQKSGIPEGRGYGGFPVSGKFLYCTDPEIVSQHSAKVYGKAEVGAPPMSMPHLDARVIDGQRSLLFGPFAGFSPKFLKSGSNLDLLKSVRPDNLFPMLAAGRDNMSLTQYLIGECLKNHKNRCNSLRDFFPNARNENWRLQVAGQRVQIIKRDEKRGGRLQFGTEVVAANDGSLAAVLGASPGASTAVSIALQLLEKCFPKEMSSDDWRNALSKAVPSYGKLLAENPDLYHHICQRADCVLNLGTCADKEKF